MRYEEQSFNIKEEGWKKRRSFEILNKSMVSFHYILEMSERTFNVWEMKMEAQIETGVVSWSNLLTIGPIFVIEKHLLFLSSHEFLMEDD